MALSANGQVAVTENGNGKELIELVNLRSRTLISSRSVGKAWLGLAFSKKRAELYASGGNDNIIIRYAVNKDGITNADTLVLGRSWPKEKISPTGLTLDEARDRIYIVTKEDNALYIGDTKTMKVLARVQLSAEAYTCVLDPAKRELYISAWGGRKVWFFNTKENRLVDSVETGDHPTDMAVDAKGKWLYVANASANTVSVISLSSHKVVESLNTALAADAPIGSTTNSVALSPDNKTLYIANADNNYLAVFDVSAPGHSRSTGFIPVGWYPTCVRTWGSYILVTNGKGLSSMANPGALNPGQPKHKNGYKSSGEGTQPKELYTGSMFKGSLSVIAAPDAAALKKYTQQVYENTPYSGAKEKLAPGEAGNPIPRKAGETSPIKYVFYVLKENRTYDQVLGDMPQGNGDTSLCLFGRQVTPNAHALSESFVLLDNFYVDAEVSADGHNWSMAGYATDFVEKNWPYNYAGRGGNYDFDGSRAIANPTKGFIWNYCQRAGIPFRNYGEFMDNGYPTLDLLKEANHYCKGYPGWNLKVQDVYRESVFEHDFDSLVAAGAVPRFSTIYLPNDHTSGLSRGAYTPVAQIADNDLAFGRLVDHISHSPVWKDCAIFVLEDDAQDGPDHVDAHRSPAYVISPYIKHQSVNHTLYSTTSILRTMELILGLPAMSQYDAAATPLYACFSPAADTSAYTCRPAMTDINARNAARNVSAVMSAHFDLSRADAVPDALLNEVLWKAIKGENSPVPEPRRSAFVKTTKDKDD
jgi:DNA-binding beta-propeller fold protein YncE/phospholipase C